MKKNVFILIGLALSLSHFVSAKTTVSKKETGGWQLYVDDQPFTVKGVTFGAEIKKETIGKILKDLKFLGVNTVRTWGTGDETKLLLDSCQAYGIKVMVGIWMRHGRPGMEGDDSFNYLEDTQGKADMYKGALETVNKFKNHPAVLFFGVGNEVYLNIATDQEKKVYSEYLETICSAIKKADPNHPVCSVEAWSFGFKWWKQYVPSVDIYGVNVYGQGITQIPAELTKEGADKPYVVTEYGVNGEWEAKEDKNGLRVEPGDVQKYSVISPGLKNWVYAQPGCLGAYVFHYSVGNGTHGAVWLNLYYENYYRPQYWATREAFTGKKPVNNVPAITSFTLPDTIAASGTWIKVKLKTSDLENDKLDISFKYNQRIGSRARKDEINPLEFRGNLTDGYEIKLPADNGLIKVYAFVKDTYNNLGIAQTSFKIDNGPNADTFIPGARTTLPFYIYKDGKDMPYSPTAYMGDFQHMKVDANNKERVHSGMSCMKISYDKVDGWFGLALVDPPGDWGDRPGGFNVTGATKFTFWAKATSTNASATIGYGLIGNDKAFFDTDKKSIKIDFTTEWKKYEITLNKADLRCIRSGLTIYSAGIGEPFSIYLDDVMFEK